MACVITVLMILLALIVESVIIWKDAKIADVVKIVQFFVPTAELVMFAQAVTEISAITVNCAKIVR